jgi:hypothetical protein
VFLSDQQAERLDLALQPTAALLVSGSPEMHFRLTLERMQICLSPPVPDHPVHEDLKSKA